MTRALELASQERFADALAAVGRLPAERARDPNVVLFRAVLLCHRGDVAAAKAACAELLALDELSAGAHYVLALCREADGDRKAAIDHDQTAAYLDPTFAMPHLHMGLLARRAGDRRCARRTLGTALRLLRQEDASRLVLFGGGFGRDGLVALCRTALDRLGGAE
jgi:chemotaxis protein methyltransferase CheR